MYFLKESDRDNHLIEFSDYIDKKYKFLSTREDYGVITNSDWYKIVYFNKDGERKELTLEDVANSMGLFRVLDGEGNRETLSKVNRESFVLYKQGEDVSMPGRVEKRIDFKDQKFYNFYG